MRCLLQSYILLIAWQLLINICCSELANNVDEKQLRQDSQQPPQPHSTETFTRTDVVTTDSIPHDDECGTVKQRWSEANVQDVIRLWNLNDQDATKLRQLGAALADVDHWKNDPYEVVRFLTDMQFDVTKSEPMFRKMIQWRLDHQMDTFLERYTPSELIYYSPIFMLRGLDLDNDPIYVIRIGELDAWGLYKSLGYDGLLEANLFVTELMSTRQSGLPHQYNWQRDSYEAKVGRKFAQFTCIVDLKGLSTQLVRPTMLGVLKESARISQDMYPGYSKRAIIIRAPKIFRMAWEVIQTFYDSRVRDKLVFVTEDDYLDVLEKYLNRAHLPAVIDPVQGKGQPMPGYFENVKMEGGRIPRQVLKTP